MRFFGRISDGVVSITYRTLKSGERKAYISGRLFPRKPAESDEDYFERLEGYLGLASLKQSSEK